MNTGKRIKYAEVIKAESSDSLIIMVWYTDMPEKTGGFLESDEAFNEKMITWKKTGRAYMVPPKNYKPLEDLVIRHLASIKKVDPVFVTVHSQGYLKTIASGFPVPVDMLVIDEGNHCAYLKEKLIPVFNILDRGEKVGVMYNEETADKVTDYLNQGKEFISAFAANTGKLIEQMIEAKSASNAARVQELEAKILSFRNDLVWNERLKNQYDDHFGINTETEGKI